MAEGSRASARPEELLRSTERFERFATELVRLEPFPLEEVRTTVERFAADLERHLEARPAGSAGGRPVRPRRLEAEHERFRSSIEQLLVLLEVVAGDDHGGHRQALGQYGRLVAEALRRHLADELGPARRPADARQS